jgi:hypothetical protein
MRRHVLLACGIVASVLYAAMNVFVAMQWPEYSSASQTVSELSAVGAPTRSLWIVLAIPYTLLTAAFGWGVWESAGNNRALRAAGTLIVTYGLTGLAWPLAPMHLREVLSAGGATMTDTLHLGFAMVTVIIMVLAMACGAAALGWRFRLYSVATIVLLAVFGLLTSLDAPRLEANQPTPWIGIWERINIGVFLLWVIVLAAMLWRDRRPENVPLTAASPR